MKAYIITCKCSSRIRIVAALLWAVGTTMFPGGLRAAEPIGGVPWPATDALGRSLPMAGERGVPAPRAGRYVGIFYFLWHNDPRGKPPAGSGPYDVSRILAEDPDAPRDSDSPLWGPVGVPHYWAEPLYGYYSSADPWVLRRHAQLLGAAGIDVLIFDTTNAVTYADAYRQLCSVFRDVRKTGGRMPGIAFMVNTRAGETAEEIYRDLYQPGLFRDLWFTWEGKPLLICDPKEASPELRRFFTLRRAHWPFTQENTPFAWHWEAAYPQHYGYTTDPDKPEQVNVSVAQNLRVRDGQVTTMSAGDARGRSFHDGSMDRSPGAVDRGLNVQEQWERALALDPPFVMVTGWNEWFAQRFGDPGGPVIFVDQFDREYSRDIEPMKGGHGDNYYYQLVANVRRYKGVEPLPRASASRSIRIDGGMQQWADVLPVFGDDEGDTLRRDSAGVGGLHYRDRTGRNDLIVLKVARDSAHVAFYARTRQPLTAPSDPNWMWLLIDADRNPATGWEGYDFIVNREIEGDGSTWLEKNEGGWRWKRVARVPFRVADKELHLAIPRESLGLPRDQAGVSLDFKWADHLAHPGDALDLYVSGDSAPEGRYRYRYVAE
jgi:hypothetical protein